MSVHSAGILVYRYKNSDLQVLLVHPGGPFWSRKDLGSWSIPKGIFDESENPLDAAKREFMEETGFAVEGEFIELGELRQPSKKIIHAWSIEDNFDISQLKSNTFKLEWPRKSGNILEYPEVDKGEWFSLDIAQKKIFKGQREFLARLVKRVQFSRNKV
ncbi:MAG: NUDIX domain-containing protein [Xenococcaceae cyanobacterium MO_188.B19]|nr:NUDIX domain-containing protein [Xenococcaceae cyanobacterium MO_188.B19]